VAQIRLGAGKADDGARQKTGFHSAMAVLARGREFHRNAFQIEARSCSSD
jgi:hypothetical protein